MGAPTPLCGFCTPSCCHICIPTVTGTYSLVVTFPNGCTATSNEIFVIVTIVGDLEKNIIQVFPNPAADKIYLRKEFAEPVVSAMIYSIKGQVILKDKKGSAEIDISALPEGMYIINVIEGDDVYVGKWVKE